jgi:hypothetical protein
VTLLGVAIVLVLLTAVGTFWWRARSLDYRLDQAPVPTSWTTARTFSGHGVDALAGDHNPWVARLYTTTQAWPAAVSAGESFLRRWGCANVSTSAIPPTNKRTATFQSDCGTLNATLTVSRGAVTAGSQGRSFRATAPASGAAIELWICNLSALGG